VNEGAPMDPIENADREGLPRPVGVELVDDSGAVVGTWQLPLPAQAIVVVARYGKLTHPFDRHELELRSPRFENKRFALIEIEGVIHE
jgi:hypothetical protein